MHRLPELRACLFCQAFWREQSLFIPYSGCKMGTHGRLHPHELSAVWRCALSGSLSKRCHPPWWSTWQCCRRPRPLHWLQNVRCRLPFWCHALEQQDRACFQMWSMWWGPAMRAILLYQGGWLSAIADCQCRANASGRRKSGQGNTAIDCGLWSMADSRQGRIAPQMFINNK